MTDSNLQLKNKVIPIKAQPQVIFKDIIGHGSAMRKIFRIVEKVASSDTTIRSRAENRSAMMPPGKYDSIAVIP